METETLQDSINYLGCETCIVEKQEQALLLSFQQRNINTPFVKYLENKYQNTFN